MPRIFISYRRQDSEASILDLYKRVTAIVPPEAVFLDKVSIMPGDDFRVRMQHALRTCDVLLAVIGPQWQDCFEERASSKAALDNEDQVRVEIETALRLDKHVVPLVLHPASLPDRERLPLTIREITNNHVLEVDLSSAPEHEQLGEQLRKALDQRFNQRLGEISKGLGLPKEGIKLVFEVIKSGAMDDSEGGFPAEKVWRSFLATARKKYGAKWKNSLVKLGITRSEDVGVIVFAFILKDILLRDDTERPSDFWDKGKI